MKRSLQEYWVELGLDSVKAEERGKNTLDQFGRIFTSNHYLVIVMQMIPDLFLRMTHYRVIMQKQSEVPAFFLVSLTPFMVLYM